MIELEFNHNGNDYKIIADADVSYTTYGDHPDLGGGRKVVTVEISNWTISKYNEELGDYTEIPRAIQKQVYDNLDEKVWDKIDQQAVEI